MCLKKENTSWIPITLTTGRLSHCSLLYQSSLSALSRLDLSLSLILVSFPCRSLHYIHEALRIVIHDIFRLTYFLYISLSSPSLSALTFSLSSLSAFSLAKNILNLRIIKPNCIYLTGNETTLYIKNAPDALEPPSYPHLSHLSHLSHPSFSLKTLSQGVQVIDSS